MNFINQYKNLHSKNKVILVPAYIILFLIIAFQVYIIMNLTPEEKTLFNYSSITTNLISIFGSIASVVGLIIAYLQIREIKQKAIKTEELSIQTSKQIEDALERIREIYNISSITNTINLVREIQSYLSNEELKPSLMRMKDLKTELIKISNDSELKRITNQRSFRQQRNLFEIDLRNLSTFIDDSSKNIDLKIVSNNLEDTVTELINIENQLTRI